MTQHTQIDEFASEVAANNNVVAESERYIGELASELSQRKTAKKIEEYFTENLEVVTEQLLHIQNANKSTVHRLYECATTHRYQEKVISYLNEMGQDIKEFVKQKGSVVENSIVSSHLKNNMGICVKFDEPYCASVDGKVQHSEMWFLEPNGAALLENADLFSLLADIEVGIGSLNASKLVAKSNLIIDFCVKSGLVRKQDGSMVTKETFATMKTPSLCFFLIIFGMFYKDGDWQRLLDMQLDQQVKK